jgi:hypothetical protein
MNKDRSKFREFSFVLISLLDGSDKASYKGKDKLQIKEENVNKHNKRQSVGKQGYKEHKNRTKGY